MKIGQPTVTLGLTTAVKTLTKYWYKLNEFRNAAEYSSQVHADFKNETAAEYSCQMHGWCRKRNDTVHVAQTASGSTKWEEKQNAHKA
jgi:hypothetical protein